MVSYNRRTLHYSCHYTAIKAHLHLFKEVGMHNGNYHTSYMKCLQVSKTYLSHLFLTLNVSPQAQTLFSFLGHRQLGTSRTSSISRGKAKHTRSSSRAWFKKAHTQQQPDSEWTRATHFTPATASATVSSKQQNHFTFFVFYSQKSPDKLQ